MFYNKNNKIKEILKSKKGFTLVEAMISLFILSFVLAGMYSMLIAGNITWSTYSAAVRAQQEARNSLLNMVKDLRPAEDIVLNATVDNVNLNFNHPSKGAVNYSWTNSGTTANQLLRQINGGTQVIISENIASLFITNSADSITIDITASVERSVGNSQRFELIEMVAKRQS